MIPEKRAALSSFSKQIENLAPAPGQARKNLVNLRLNCRIHFIFVKADVLLADKSVVTFPKASILSNLSGKIELWQQIIGL